jgi:hypothetical protein
MPSSCPAEFVVLRLRPYYTYFQMPPVLTLQNVLKGFDFVQCRTSEASPHFPLSTLLCASKSPRLFSQASRILNSNVFTASRAPSRLHYSKNVASLPLDNATVPLLPKPELALTPPGRAYSTRLNSVSPHRLQFLQVNVSALKMSGSASKQFTPHTECTQACGHHVHVRAPQQDHCPHDPAFRSAVESRALARRRWP